MVDKRKDPKGSESDDQLRAFLVGIATDPAALGRYVRDPETSMAEADLSPADAAVLRSGDPTAINARLAGGPGAAAGGAAMLVVDVAGEDVAVRSLAPFPQLVQQVHPHLMQNIHPQLVQIHPQLVQLAQPQLVNLQPQLVSQLVAPMNIHPPVRPLQFNLQVSPPQFTPPQFTPPQFTPPQFTPPQFTPPQFTLQVSPPQFTPPQFTPPQFTPPQFTPPQLVFPQIQPQQLFPQIQPLVTPGPFGQ